ncbi:MAG TPA: YfhO family protein, partial [Bacteroidales bacterium]|nr:YfhO family protein [Bacteroidales bacterium]
IYRCKTEKERIAVFSEIYYPAGWSAKIDGQPVEIIRVNYILRALRVPAGEHEIEFNYMPESIEKGATYSGIASGILIILLISGVLLEIKRVYIKKKK